jgi:dihydrofolate synthase/folylpolyglutamate synthase
MLHNPSDVIAHLYSLHALGIKFGLEKIARASSLLGDPHSAYPSIHVAGTNGKGSTCAYLESCIRRYGNTTGLFMSPHLVRFEERFCINGKPAATEQWMAVYRDVADIITELKLTFFEATALIAFELFRREGVAWAIFEVGMGGRLDATNIVRPRAAVIATLDYDHRDFLGETLVAIAREKLGIAKNGIPLIALEPAQPDVRAEIEQVCAERNAPLHFVSPETTDRPQQTEPVNSFNYQGRSFALPLLGNYQTANALLALRTLDILGFSDQEINAAGLRSAFLPGRFQLVSARGRSFIFDVGHNPQAARMFSETLRWKKIAGPTTLIVGIMRDKEKKPMLQSYSTVADRMILVKPLTDRAEKPEALASMVPSSFAGTVKVVPDIAEAINDALLSAGGTVCVVGSFFTVGEAMTALGIDPYERA